MKSKNKDAEVIALRQSILNYLDNVDALLCFANCVTFDDTSKNRIEGSEFSFGKSMVTSPENLVLANNVVTPDAVIQRNADLGYVTESKSSVPIDSKQLEDDFWQVVKYNDRLSGWWTPTKLIPTTTSVVLIPYEYVKRFSEEFAKFISDQKINLKHHYSIVAYTRDREPRFGEFIHLQEESGDIVIEDSALKEKLHYGKRILLEPVKANEQYGNIKFYDSEPPVEHTMIVLWQHVFNSMKTNDAFVEETQTYEISVNAQNLTEHLREHFGSRGSATGDPSFPLLQWVRNAMDAFVRMNLAQKGLDDEYVVQYYELRKELIERFSGHGEAPEPDQEKLF